MAILLPFVANGPASRRPIGQSHPACGRNCRRDAGKNTLNSLVEGLPGRAGLRHSSAHCLHVEWLLPENLVNMILRLVVLGLGAFDRGAVGVDLAAQDIAVGRGQRGGEPFYPHEYVTVPIRWR